MTYTDAMSYLVASPLCIGQAGARALDRPHIRQPGGAFCRNRKKETRAALSITILMLLNGQIMMSSKLRRASQFTIDIYRPKIFLVASIKCGNSKKNDHRDESRCLYLIRCWISSPGLETSHVKGQIERTRLENDRQPTIESSYTTNLHIAQPSQPTGVYSTSEYLKEEEEEEEIESALPTQKKKKRKEEKKRNCTFCCSVAQNR